MSFSTAFSISLLLHVTLLMVVSSVYPVPSAVVTEQRTRLEAWLGSSFRDVQQSDDINQRKPRELGKTVQQSVAAEESFIDTRSLTRTPHIDSLPPRGVVAEVPVDFRLLDVRPAIKTRTMPDYPKTLPKNSSGSVVIELLITKTGKVDSVQVTSSSGFQEMDASAVAAFLAAEFTPGRIGNFPVATKIRIAVDFDGSE